MKKKIIFIIITPLICGNLSSNHNFWHSPSVNPYKPSIDNFINTLRHDLIGTTHNGSIIPYQEVNDFLAFVKQTLQNCSQQELQNTDLINQYIRSALLEYVNNKITHLITQLRKEGYRISSQQESSIKNSESNNLIASLGRISHGGLSGEVLYPYFGNELRKRILAVINNPTYHNNTSPNTPYYPTQSVWVPHQPTPSAPSLNKREIQAMHNKTQFEKELLNTELSNTHIKRLAKLIEESTLYITQEKAENYLFHAKHSFAQFLDEQLEEQRKILSYDIIHYNKLLTGIEETRQQVIAAINSLTHINKNTINTLFTLNNLKERIIENISDLSCPICFEFFKQEHRTGTVSKIILKAENHLVKCNHAVCKNCIQYCYYICPLCRAKLDKYALDYALKTSI